MGPRSCRSTPRAHRLLRPRFWRPAPDARDRQRQFFGHQIRDPHVLTLRTDHGFVFAAPRGQVLDVDDLALDDDDLWAHDGTALLQATLQEGDLRFVCPVPEPARTQTAVDLGMILVESWWHRDLATDGGDSDRRVLHHAHHHGGRCVRPAG